MLQEGYKLKENYVSNNKREQNVSGASDNSKYLDKTYSITNANYRSETTSIKQVPRFFVLQEGCKLKGNYVSNNKREQSVSGASDNSEYFDETYSITSANGCSENTLLSDSRNISTTNQKLGTELLSKSNLKLNYLLN
jgi:hypothetical protein